MWVVILICWIVGGFVIFVVKLFLDFEFVFIRYELFFCNFVVDVLWNVLVLFFDLGCFFSFLLWIIWFLLWCIKFFGGLFVIKLLFFNIGWLCMGWDFFVLCFGFLSVLFIGMLFGFFVWLLYFLDLCFIFFFGVLLLFGVKFILGLEFLGVNFLLLRLFGIKLF